MSIFDKINDPNEYFKALTADQRAVIEYLNKRMIEKHITNEFTRAGILAVCSKESAFKMRSEKGYENTDNARIRQVFGSRVQNFNDTALSQLKKDPERFFNVIYGGRFGNASNEGYKYRGRGFNQLTFKANYDKIGKQIGVDLVANPDKLMELPVATDALIQYFVNAFSSCPPKLLEQTYGIDITIPKKTPQESPLTPEPDKGIVFLNNIKSLDMAVKSAYHANAGWGKSISALETDSTGGRKKAIDRSAGFLEIVKSFNP